MPKNKSLIQRLNCFKGFSYLDMFYIAHYESTVVCIYVFSEMFRICVIIVLSINIGVEPKIVGKLPQIIHLFRGFGTIIFTIHFGGFPPIVGNIHIDKFYIAHYGSMGRLYIYLHENHKNQPFM